MSVTGKAQVAAIDRLAGDVCALTLRSVDVGFFETASPGAHIDVDIPAIGTRQYSLYEWSDDGSTVRLAVKNEFAGRGGSRWICSHLQAGAIVNVGKPRNHFRLNETADHYLLIAGGIGITPIYAMARRLRALNKPFNLHYLTRSPASSAFESVLDGAGLASNVRMHFSDTEGLPDFDSLLSEASQSTEIYVCGPEPMLRAIVSAASRRNLRLSFERFSPVAAPGRPSEGFKVQLARSGQEFFVPPDKSLLDALKDHGVHVDSGCHEGVCGSCLTGVLEGDIDHRDSVLDDQERARNKLMCVCVSRARSERVVLDL